MTFTLRVPVRTLGDQPITGIDPKKSLEVDGIKLWLTSDPPLLITTAEGFLSEADAISFIPRIISALWALVVQWNVAFRADFNPTIVKYVSDPVAAGNNIARSFGQEPAQPVDALEGIEDVIVFQTGKRLRYIGVGDARAVVTTPIDLALPTFVDTLTNPAARELVHDERFKTAVELFNGYFYETSLRAKFLTLVMILEVLAPNVDKHPIAQRLILEFKNRVTAILHETADRDSQHALESLGRELEFRRETSIRQRVRRLVQQQFADLDSVERLTLEREAVSSYDARGTLVHTGSLADAQLDEAHQKASNVVRRILGRKLGIRAF